MDKKEALSDGKAIIDILYLEGLYAILGQLEVEKQKYILLNKAESQDKDDWLMLQEVEIEKIRGKIQETDRRIKALNHEKEDQRQSWWIRIRKKY